MSCALQGCAAGHNWGHCRCGGVCKHPYWLWRWGPLSVSHCLWLLPCEISCLNSWLCVGSAVCQESPSLVLGIKGRTAWRWAFLFYLKTSC